MTTNNDQEEVIRTLEDEQLSEKIKALCGRAVQKFMLNELG